MYVMYLRKYEQVSIWYIRFVDLYFYKCRSDSFNVFCLKFKIEYDKGKR